MPDLDECYRILGLTSGASPGEIRSAYLDLVKVWHPDRFTHDPKLKLKAQDQLRVINAAYERLKSVGPRPSSRGPNAPRTYPTPPPSPPTPQGHTASEPQGPPPPFRRFSLTGIYWLIPAVALILIVVVSRETSHKPPALSSAIDKGRASEGEPLQTQQKQPSPDASARYAEWYSSRHPERQQEQLSPDASASFTIPSPEELERYYAVYRNPYVQHLRKALNVYLSGQAEGIEGSAVGGYREGKTIPGLASFDKSYYRSPFVVFSVSGHIGGGMGITLLFQQRPDRLFWAWVYRTSDGEYVLRQFGSDDLPPERVKELVTKLKAERALK